MNKLINLIVLIFLISTIVFSITAPVQAQVNLSDKLINVGTKAGFQNSEEQSLPQLVGAIIRGFLSLLGIIFMGYIVYAGSLWITARGEEEKIDKAKKIIRGSIIGLIIVLGAYAITGFVITRIVDTTNFQG